MEVERKIGLEGGSQARKVAEEVEVDGWLPVEELQPVWLEVVDWKGQALDVVRQMSKSLGVASREVLEAQHPDVVVHERSRKK